MTLTSINPATGKKIADYTPIKIEEALLKCQYSYAAFEKWRDSSFTHRAQLFKTMEQKLLDNIDSLSTLITSEMGKPIRQAWAEIEKCASLCTYYAEHGETFLRPTPVDMGAIKSYFAYEPLGVILAIMPWNYPFWQVFRAAVPALMAGNGMVLKHAPSVTGCSLAMEKLFTEAGFPESLFQSLLIEENETTLSLIESPIIQGVTLTGSVKAGKSVASKAGACLKKCVLELGGSDPYVILEDANTEEAAVLICDGRFNNAGQSCISPKRIIIVDSQYEKFEKAFIQCMKRITVGDPRDETVTMGPLARLDLRDTLHDQVMRSIKLGATCVMGGNIPKRDGAFYEPTLLTTISKEMPATQEELFGPVAVLIKAKDEEDALRIANDTSFGLGAAVFTQDRERGEEIALKQMNAGSGFVNAIVRSDPRLPFGGIKQSGLGRELSSVGITEFTNCKTIFVS